MLDTGVRGCLLASAENFGTSPLQLSDKRNVHLRSIHCQPRRRKGSRNAPCSRTRSVIRDVFSEHSGTQRTFRVRPLARGDSYALASTSKFAPSARAILTRLPAGQSGPETRQIVSSMWMVPIPLTIGLSR